MIRPLLLSFATKREIVIISLKPFMTVVGVPNPFTVIKNNGNVKRL